VSLCDLPLSRSDAHWSGSGKWTVHRLLLSTRRSRRGLGARSIGLTSPSVECRRTRQYAPSNQNAPLSVHTVMGRISTVTGWTTLTEWLNSHDRARARRTHSQGTWPRAAISLGADGLQSTRGACVGQQCGGLERASREAADLRSASGHRDVCIPAAESTAISECQRLS
jgi:hypothetical protein